MIEDGKRLERRMRLPAILLAALLLAAVGVGTVSAMTWQLETVLGSGEVGDQDISLALDSAGHPHICYYEDISDRLKYVTYDGSAWSFETVDPEQGVGVWASIAVDGADQPRISYEKVQWGPQGGDFSLRYAQYDVGPWQIETADSGGGGPESSLALDAAGNPRIAYLDDDAAALKYAAFDGTAWQITTVDSSVLGSISMALDTNGNPHISYTSDLTRNYDLRHAWYDGAWHTETVNAEGSTGFGASIALDPTTGYPRISYCGDGLQYAAYNGASWDLEKIPAGSIQGATSLALDPSTGHPRISYVVDEGSQCYPDDSGDPRGGTCDPPNYKLAFASFDGTTWQTEIVDPSGVVSALSDLALDSAGNPRIVYHNRDTGNLVYAVGTADTPPPAGERIAFSAFPIIEDLSKQEGYRIHVMAPDGAGLTWFGEGAGIDTDHLEPSWSPDGSKIVCHDFDTSNRDSVIFVMNADGTGRTYLTSLPDPAEFRTGCVQPAWSPRGSLIAYASDDSRDYIEMDDPVGLDIFVMSPDGTGKTQLTSSINPGSNAYPAWSPDGSKIAFATSRDGNYEIYVMNADGSDPTRVTNNPATDTKPAWSSEGKIAFVSDRDGNNEIYVINPDGTGETRLTSDPGADDDPAWSPDGSRIAFTRAAPSHMSELYFMDKDGSQQTLLPLGDSLVGVRCPAWRSTSMPPANLPPSASFTAVPEEGLAPLTVAFDAAASSDTDGTIASYAWAFGDGSTGTGVATSHPYASPGTYTATLTVTDDDGETDTASTTIYALTPAEATSDLRDQVMAYGVRADVRKGLTDKLDIVTAALTQGNEKMAVNNLNAFIKLVLAQKGKALTAAQADALIAEARKIIATIQL